MTPTDIELDEVLRRLRLANIRLTWRTIIQRAEHNSWSYRDFLTHILAAEMPRGPSCATEPNDDALALGAYARDASPSPVLASVSRRISPRSAAERWAGYVIRGCESDGDPKTIGDWARSANVSYSGLCESCRLLDVQPRNGRDFTRVLRALLKCSNNRSQASAFLNVSDGRTLNAILDKAGFGRRRQAGQCMAVDEFLRLQRFIAVDNSGLRALTSLIAAGPAA